MPNPKVSIVCATYQRLDHFRNLVLSIRSAFPRESYEIVAVTSDPTHGEKIEWMVAQPDINVIQAGTRMPGEHRKGSLYAFENIGIKEARNEWVFVTNDDTEFDPFFYTHFKALADDNDVIMVNGHLGDVGLGCRTAVIGHVCPPEGHRRPLYLYDFTIIRKSVYERIGYLDEGLDWFGKGFDLAMQCETLLPPLRVCYVSDLKVNHTIAAEGRTPPHYARDFQYATDKWRAWCFKTNWEFSWPW